MQTLPRLHSGVQRLQFGWTWLPLLLALLDWRLGTFLQGPEAREDWLLTGTWLLVVVLTRRLGWRPAPGREVVFGLGLAYLLVLVARLQPLEFYGGWIYRLGVAGLLAIATPWRTLPYHRCWLALLLVLALPWSLLSWQVLPPLLGDALQHWTAWGSAGLLQYLTFDVRLDGTWVHLPTGAVEVRYPCSPGPLLVALLQAALLLRGLAYWNGAQHSWVRTLAWVLGLGFGITLVRVAFLAVVVHRPALFDYWHGDTGSQLVSMVAVLTLAIATGGLRWR